jgi:hypothetical protein
MIVLRFPNEVEDKVAKAVMQAAKILFNSKREGFRVEWQNPQTLEIYQSETLVSVKRDVTYLEKEDS